MWLEPSATGPPWPTAATVSDRDDCKRTGRGSPGAGATAGNALEQELAEGLVRALRFLAGRGLSSFNLAFFPSAGERDVFWLHLRLSPRLYLAPRPGASDISSLQHLYQESTMIWTPEELAAGLRGAVRPT
ncbi:MAG: hypothetical protein QJR14_06330 [Bacillota bacterium]|nr:hypothetical protein [Bacillota bacterium]